jgi:hypothetical protein
MRHRRLDVPEHLDGAEAQAIETKKFALWED